MHDIGSAPDAAGGSRLEHLLRRPPPGPRCGLPRGVVVLLSAAIAAHLSALAAQVLAAPSGPWPTPFGVGPASEPQFARSLSDAAAPFLLKPFKLSDNYHFAGSRPGQTAAWFEVRLKDAQGRPLNTVRVPDDGANFWVRHRQGLLAQALTNDEPVEPRGGEVIAAPTQQVQTATFWEPSADRTLRLRSAPEHLVPRDRPVFRPSAWSLTLARSYVRCLCRVHGAASGELVRHSREPSLPAMMFLEEAPPGAFDELVSSFGEMPR